MHVDGAGLLEQAIVIEELGRAAHPGRTCRARSAAALIGENASVVAGAVAIDGAALVCGGALADVIVCEVDGCADHHGRTDVLRDAAGFGGGHAGVA